MSKAECGDIVGLVPWDGIREDLQAGIRDHSPRTPYQRQSESPLLIARLRIFPLPLCIVYVLQPLLCV
jgi:hypothetical protein